MYLDGSLTARNFSSNLFVQFAQCHQGYDITLTQRKGLEAGAHVGNSLCVTALGAVATQAI